MHIQIRLFYISSDNYLREMETHDFSDNWDRGLLDYKNYKTAPNSGILYACNPSECRDPGNPRVGFQAAESPEVITEAVWLADGWSVATLWSSTSDA